MNALVRVVKSKNAAELPSVNVDVNATPLFVA